MRFLGEALSFLFFLLLIRSVISGAMQLFRASTSVGNANRQTAGSQSTTPEVPTSGELRKDPSCGTFVMMNTPYTKLREGVTFYFCSKECRDRYKPGSGEAQWQKSTAARS